MANDSSVTIEQGRQRVRDEDLYVCLWGLHAAVVEIEGRKYCDCARIGEGIAAICLKCDDNFMPHFAHAYRKASQNS